MFFFKCNQLVPILRNGFGIWGQNYLALFQENEITAELHSRNLILGVECFLPYLPTGRVLLTVFVFV